MKRWFVVLFLLASTSVVAGTSLTDAIKQYVASAPLIQVTMPSDWQCFQPGIVQTTIATLNWQRQRIADLEHRLAAAGLPTN